jgi:hypothetical protein
MAKLFATPVPYEPIFDLDIEDALVPDDEEPPPSTLRAPTPVVIQAVDRLGLLAREAEREARRLQVAEDLAALRGTTLELAGDLQKVLKHLELVLGVKLRVPS